MEQIQNKNLSKYVAITEIWTFYLLVVIISNNPLNRLRFSAIKDK